MTTLYLGPEVPLSLQKGTERIIHCPVIRIVPRSAKDPAIAIAIDQWDIFTHLIFTSKAAVDTSALFFNMAEISGKLVISVGAATTARLEDYGITVKHTAERETAEGVVELLSNLHLSEAQMLWPRSARARPVISDYLQQRGVAVQSPPIYDTELFIPDDLPKLSSFDTVYFSSPSTIDGFLNAYGEFPKNIAIRCIGPITKAYLTTTV